MEVSSAKISSDDCRMRFLRYLVKIEHVACAFSELRKLYVFAW
jgi:hypothetical protein